MTYNFNKSLTFDATHDAYGQINPGEWAEADDAVLACCPKCTHYISLKGHTIHNNGIVEPSVLHQFSYWNEKLQIYEERCGFHEMIKLLDWTS